MVAALSTPDKERDKMIKHGTFPFPALMGSPPQCIGQKKFTSKPYLSPETRQKVGHVSGKGKRPKKIVALPFSSKPTW